MAEMNTGKKYNVEHSQYLRWDPQKVLKNNRSKFACW